MKKNTRFFFKPIVALLLLSINSNCAPKETLYIQVVDEISKEPIANARVRAVPKHFFIPGNNMLSFLSPNDPSPILELFPEKSVYASTDAKGNATMLLNSKKPHILTANANNYSRLKIEIVMKNNLFIKNNANIPIKKKYTSKNLEILFIKNSKIE